jgi:predicted ATP-grasp superfamily ATP-dependent carboligase
VYPDLVDMALTLLKEMHWYGPAEVEFRIDTRDGRPTLMEVNPRLCGSMYTATACGRGGCGRDWAEQGASNCGSGCMGMDLVGAQEVVAA